MTIEEVRAEITQIDEEIILLIARRQSLAGKIAAIKQERGIPVHDNQRKIDVLDYVMKLAKAHHIDPVPIKGIFETLIGMNEKAQRAAMEKPVPKRTARK
ncbi:chorismate mutase [Methanoregula sp.]|uniref:chorismate mutase n=1 Tax=Methanoregula sp. TaxID=2052170 RepID=UPI002CC68753|nr:chorismate mutase [Methanoregula sp.]HVP95772.1 chorismate mutase [Methanoregula sp.]